MRNPLISVIIPVRDSAETIGEAIDSIINQTYRNLEIIVANDNSSDNTKEAVEKIMEKDGRVKYFPVPFDDPNRVNKRGRNINAGWSARNYGLEMAAGEWITFQDADDVSFLNRIEWQLKLALKHNTNHLCTNMVPWKPEWVGKKFDVERYLADNPNYLIGPRELREMAKKTKGVMPKLLGRFHSKVPFSVKTARVLNKLFFGNLQPYPGAANSPLFKREVAEKVKFRPRDERVWPSFVGRGADRDFNFQVAETFRNSVVVKVPLYMWRQDPKGFDFGKYEKYII